MKYTFETELSWENIKEYTESFPFAPIQQTPSWTKVKQTWKHCCFALRDEHGKICGSAVVLIRRLAPGLSLAYCPRGPLADLSDPEITAAFADGLRNWAKKHGIYCVRVDPLLLRNKKLPEISENYQCDFPVNDEMSFRNLIASGFVHGGFKNEVHAYTQPRFNAVVPLFKADGTPMSRDELRKNFGKTTKYYTGNRQRDFGLYVEKPEIDKNVISEFVSILRHTELRQNISLRNKEYFERLTEAFGDDAAILFVGSNLEHYRGYLSERINKEPENAENLKKKLKGLEQAIKDNGTSVLLSAMLIVFPPNSEGPRTAEYLYAGANLSICPECNATGVGLLEAMLLANQKNCAYLNLGGFDGSFNDNLYSYKSKFNPICAEYYGEFDLIVNKTKYRLAEKMLPYAKKALGSLNKLKSAGNKNES